MSPTIPAHPLLSHAYSALHSTMLTVWKNFAPFHLSLITTYVRKSVAVTRLFMVASMICTSTTGECAALPHRASIVNRRFCYYPIGEARHDPCMPTFAVVAYFLSVVRSHPPRPYKALGHMLRPQTFLLCMHGRPTEQRLNFQQREIISMLNSSRFLLSVIAPAWIGFS